MSGSTGVFELSAIATGVSQAAFVLPIVNTTDTTQAPQGSLVKITLAQLYRGESVSLTASTPLPDIRQKWNNVAVTFTGVLVSITDTTSAAASKVQDWQVNGVSIAAITKTGGSFATLTVAGAFTASGTASLTLSTAAQPNVTSLGTLTSLTVSGLITAQAGIALTGSLAMATAASKIIPGATSFSVRNNADGADNLIILNSGAATFRSSLTVAGAATLQSTLAVTGAITATGGLVGTITTAAQPNITSLGTLASLTVTGSVTADSLVLTNLASKIVPGVNSLSFRNNANSADNLIITDAGGATFRSTIAVTGAATFSSTVAVGSTATLLTSTGTQTDYSGAANGTLTNAPAAGNPTKWVAFSDNGTIRKFPTWT